MPDPCISSTPALQIPYLGQCPCRKATNSLLRRETPSWALRQDDRCRCQGPVFWFLSLAFRSPPNLIFFNDVNQIHTSFGPFRWFDWITCQEAIESDLEFNPQNISDFAARIILINPDGIFSTRFSWNLVQFSLPTFDKARDMPAKVRPWKPILTCYKSMC